MRLTRRAVLLGLVVFLATVDARAVRLPDVRINVEPSPVDRAGEALVNGHRGDQVLWRSGEHEPLTVAITATLPAATKLDRLTLISTSPNWWCWVPRVKVLGRTSESESWQPLAERDWYARTPDSEEPSDSRTFTLEIPLEGRSIGKLKIELVRPNGWVNMPLSEIELHAADAVEAAVRTQRQAYRVGQDPKGFIRFDNACDGPIGNVEAAVEMIDDGGNVSGVCWRETVDLTPGLSEFEFTCPSAKTGGVRLRPLILTDLKDVAVYAYDSAEINFIPPSSRYWFPVGVCNGGPGIAHYGFSVRHDWYYPPEPTSWPSPSDPFADAAHAGMPESICHLTGFELDVPPEQARLIRADGEAISPGFCPISHHLPSYRLAEQLTERLAFWNGHPGFYQYVYNNEQCYVGWITGGLVDYNPYAVAAFRQYVGELHGSIETLNALYGTSYASFGEVEPPQKYSGPSPDWFDWLQFRKAGLANHMTRSYKLIKPHLPDTSVTFKAIQIGDYYVASAAIDPWLWRDGGDVHGFDLYPWCRDGYLEAPFGLDFHRTQVGGKPICFMESNLGYYRPSVNAREAMEFNRCYWPAFLRGLRGCTWFQWHAPWNERERGYWLSDADGSLFETGQEAVRMAKQVQTLAPVLNFAKPLGVQVALYYPWEEIDQVPNVAAINALRGAYKILTQLHHPVDIISFHNVREGELTRYRVLVLAGARHLYPDVAERIEAFVQNGGLLIADRQAGFYDHYHRQTNSLGKTLGVEHLAENDQLTQIALTDQLRIELPTVLTSPSPIENSGEACAPMARAGIIRRGEATRVLATFPDELVRQNVVDHVLDQVPTFLAPQETATQSAGPPSGLPAAVDGTFGEGRTLYVAAAVFNAYRNYFYTLSRAPNPVCRDSELLNQGDPVIRKLIGDFLSENGVTPPADVDLRDADPEVDDMHFQILSYCGDEGTAMLGVTNWGPRRRHNVPARMTLPFDRVAKLYGLDTVRERLMELPFSLDGRELATTIPLLEGTTILLAVGESGPLLAWAEQSAAGGPVRARLVNHLPETAAGMIQLRVDGVAEPLSEQVAFELAPGQEASFELALRPVDPSRLIDPRGLPRPWYAWVGYDGNARAFARVHPAGELRAP